MEKGIINYFDKNKSFGFITTMQGEKVFVHSSVISKNDRKDIIDGTVLGFEKEPANLGNKVSKIFKIKGE
jgi:cold shock CspA family protein